MSDSIIRFEKVSFHYKAEQPVLKQIDLSIRSGEFIALIGGNGSGKTTLAKHCNGLYKPTDGAVYVEGRDTREVSVAELSRIVSYCYQNPDHQIFQSTIGEEVAFGPSNLGLAKAEIEERVTQALEAVGLLPYREEEPYFVSKGTRQKIAVASILAMKPRVIVLDEPTTGLDHRGVMEMMALIQSLHRQGHTILAITHDMRLVAEYAQRVLVLHKGEIVCDGEPRHVFAQTNALSLAQVEPPAVSRFAQALGLTPLPLTLAELQDRLVKELT
ncbi:energy-coupling factor ABC transporter ATP-binding protein [Brevibacillus fulvus]|uniref:Energy-coupling factor transport system ATP-binding protein n=1 Tax=Brevibacillus fulvus TaxID=1125967 RepID=A0A938XWV4_9BACL|nr:ABC transporter ATP-binding protein [Brevibacillus fulvus]MBM7589376.1 energy-coupling factor transport system ATP-binding protein [Brevibacillus fulvus]